MKKSTRNILNPHQSRNKNLKNSENAPVNSDAVAENSAEKDEVEEADLAETEEAATAVGNAGVEAEDTAAVETGVIDATEADSFVTEKKIVCKQE